MTILSLFAILVVSQSLAGTGDAQADAQSDYLFDLTNAGIGGPRPDLVRLGTNACNEAHSNVSSQVSLGHIQDATRLSLNDSQFLYDSALKFLCPS